MLPGMELEEITDQLDMAQVVANLINEKNPNMDDSLYSLGILECLADAGYMLVQSDTIKQIYKTAVSILDGI